MAVIRSHFERSAARRASDVSVPATSAIRSASAATRSLLASSEPSCFWKVTSPSALRRAASGCLRSVCQKKAASASRGRTTRSLPARTCAGSRLSMLDTVMNHGVSLPSGPRTGK